jgi:hypothetical protein
MSVKILKLASGEEIIGDVILPADRFEVDIKKPVRIISVPTQDGEMTGFMPWLHYTDDDPITIHRDHVVCVVDPVNDVLNGYNSQFGSGVVIARPGPKLSRD